MKVKCETDRAASMCRTVEQRERWGRACKLDFVVVSGRVRVGGPIRDEHADGGGRLLVRGG